MDLVKSVMKEPMRLTSEEGEFLAFTEKKGVLKADVAWEKAQGVCFMCPKCRHTDNPHRVILLFAQPGVPPHAKPEGRWKALGTGIHDLTLLPNIRQACGWRGYVREGNIVSTE